MTKKQKIIRCYQNPKNNDGREEMQKLLDNGYKVISSQAMQPFKYETNYGLEQQTLFGYIEYILEKEVEND